MEKLLKSLLNSNYSHSSKAVISSVLEDDLFSPQEKTYFKTINSIAQETNSLPTEEYFISLYPEMSHLREVEPLPSNSITSHFGALKSQRERLKASQTILKMANSIAESGIQSEDIDFLNSLVKSECSILPVEEDVSLSKEAFSSYMKDRNSKPVGPKTGFKEIDNLIGGMAKGMTTTISAFVGGGKTTTAVNIAYRNVMEQSYNIVYISLEMSKEDLMMNLFSLHSKVKFNRSIPASDIRFNRISEEDSEFLYETVVPDYYSSMQGKLRILDETDFKSIDFNSVRETLYLSDDYFYKTTKSHTDLVMVDHVHLLKFSNTGNGKKYASEGAEGNAWVGFFRAMTQYFRDDPETNKPIKVATLLLAQCNRTGWQYAVKHSGMYQLNALAEINELERASQVVLFNFLDEDLKLQNEMKITLAKNRNGAVLPNPVVVEADLANYWVHDGTEGFSDSLTLENITDLASSGGDDISGLFEL